ncbi:MAG: glycyl-radical enzyme activating protein [Promethearchaeota archaeon]
MVRLSAEDAGNIFQIQKLSTEDGPGIRTTVFMKHCPLKCVWCHNPESISKKPILEWLEHKCIGCKTCIEICRQKALLFDEKGLHINRDKCNSCGECAEECPSTALHMVGKSWSLEDLYHEVEKDKAYYSKSKGGITISGGEPTLQPDFVLDFLKKCKENGLSTALDTCGYASQQIFDKMLPFVDLILLDIKEINSVKHKEYTGVPNELILENAKWLVNRLKSMNKEDITGKNMNKNIWIRTPIIPNYTATEENIRGIGRFIVEELGNFPDRWDLLSFNNLCADKYQRLDLNWALEGIPLMEKGEIEKLYDIAIETGVNNVRWSGLTRKEEQKESGSSREKAKLPSY